MTDTIINLTTIPPRMKKLGPVIDALLSQTAQIQSIILWIPKRYRRAEFKDYELPKLSPKIDIRICDEDFGPATKILPACQEFAGQDLRLIYCDDDEIYDRTWAKTLIDGSNEHPSSCITICGLNIENVEYEYAIQRTSHKMLNMLTLGILSRNFKRRNKPPRPGIGPVDICQGFGGVLVRPHFFSSDVYKIPDILWTVDDMWLSGQLAVNNIGIQRVVERKLCKKSDTARVFDLTNYMYKGYNRMQADFECVKYFRSHYGIWNDGSIE